MEFRVPRSLPPPIARLMHVAVSGSPDGCLQATSATCGVHGKRWVAESIRCGCSRPRESSSRPTTARCRAASCHCGAVNSCFSIARLMHVAVSGSPDGCLQATSATFGVHGKPWVAQGTRCGCSRPRESSSQPATATCRAASCHRGAAVHQHREADARSCLGLPWWLLAGHQCYLWGVQ